MLIKQFAIVGEVVLKRSIYNDGHNSASCYTKCDLHKCIHRDLKYNHYNDMSSVCPICSKTSKRVGIFSRSSKFCFIPQQ